MLCSRFLKFRFLAEKVVIVTFRNTSRMFEWQNVIWYSAQMSISHTSISVLRKFSLTELLWHLLMIWWEVNFFWFVFQCWKNLKENIFVFWNTYSDRNLIFGRTNQKETHLRDLLLRNRLKVLLLVENLDENH